MLTETEFTAAAERHLDMVYRIALNSLRHPADAEDAVQNTMLRLWRTGTDFTGEEHLRRGRRYRHPGGCHRRAVLGAGLQWLQLWRHAPRTPGAAGGGGRAAEVRGSEGHLAAEI